MALYSSSLPFREDEMPHTMGNNAIIIQPMSARCKRMRFLFSHKTWMALVRRCLREGMLVIASLIVAPFLWLAP